MTEKMFKKFRNCVIGDTYYVEGLRKPDDGPEKYWYLFRCNKVNDRTIYGSDLADWKDEKPQNWSMELEIVADPNEGIIKIVPMSVEQLKDTYPEYFL